MVPVGRGPRRQIEVDIPTLIALSTVAWALADVLHEIVACQQLFDWNAQQSAALVHTQLFGHQPFGDDADWQMEAMEAQQHRNLGWRT